MKKGHSDWEAREALLRETLEGMMRRAQPCRDLGQGIHLGWMEQQAPNLQGERELGVFKGLKERFIGCRRGPGRREQGKSRGRWKPNQLESRGHSKRFSFYYQ